MRRSLYLGLVLCGIASRTEAQRAPEVLVTGLAKPESVVVDVQGRMFVPSSEARRPPSFSQVAPAGVTDGLSNTLFFGERNHRDPNYDTFFAPGWVTEPMWQWGWWAPSGGNFGLSDVTMSTLAPINYKLGFNFDNKPSDASSQAGFAAYDALRVCSFGSQHPGGANFAMADGSVRFLKDTTAMTTLRALGTRAGGEVVSADAY